MNYNDLLTETAALLIRDDLGGRIPGFIRDAEGEFNRELMVPEREQVSTSPTSGETLALPADFYSMRSVYLDGDERVPLTQMSLQQMQTSYPVATYTGTPQYFSIQGLDLVFGPVPDKAYTVVLNYFQTIPALGPSNLTNWLLDSNPDLYLNAVQWQANVHMKDWQSAAYFKSETDRIINKLRMNGQRKAYGVSPVPYGLVRQVSGARC